MARNFGGTNLGSAHGSIELDVASALASIRTLNQSLDKFGDGPIGGIQRLSNTIGDMAKAAAIAATAVAGIGAGLAGAAIASAADFEQQMSGIKAVSGATADEMAKLQGLALKLGADTSFSAKEAAAGIEELVKGGLSVADIMNGAATATLNLAAAGGTSLPDAATIAANALAQFNLKGQDMAHVADLIAGAANASAIDVNQFKFSLQAAGAVAATVGFSFDDLAQGIAIMGKAGIAGSDAGTSLKTMMLNLQPSTKKARETMEDLGLVTFDTQKAMAFLRKQGIEPLSASQGDLQTQLASYTASMLGRKKIDATVLKTMDELIAKEGLLSNAFFDSTGKVKSMAEVAGALNKATAGLTEQQRLMALETIFGSDAIRAAAVLSKEGADGFNAMAAAMGKVTAAGVGAERLNNLKGAMEQLKGSVETAGIAFGLAFTPFLKVAAEQLTTFVNRMTPVLEQLGPKLAAGLAQTMAVVGPLVEAIARIAVGDAGFGALLTVFEGWAAVAPGLAPLVAAIRELASLAGQVDAVGQLGAALQTAMTGDLVGATTQVTTFLVNATGHWLKALTAWIGPALPGIIDGLGQIGQAILGWAAANGPAIAQEAAAWGQAVVAWVAPAIPPLLQQLAGLAQQALAWVAAQAGPLLQQFITSWVPSAVNWALDAATALVPKLGPVITAALDWITANAPSLLEKFIGEWVPAFIGWVVEAGIKITPKLAEFVGTIGAWLVNEGAPAAGRAALAIGEGVVRGIAAGMDRLRGWLLEQATSLAQGLLDGVKAQLNIRSPSAVFRDEVGIPIVQGIGAGIERAMPALERDLSQAIDSFVEAGNLAAGEAWNIAPINVDKLATQLTADIGAGMTAAIPALERDFSQVLTGVVNQARLTASEPWAIQPISRQVTARLEVDITGRGLDGVSGGSVTEIVDAMRDQLIAEAVGAVRVAVAAVAS